MKELLIDWNWYQENTTSIGFQFHSSKLSRTYAGLYKERSTEVGGGGGGVGGAREISPALSRKLEKISLIFRKNVQTVAIYWLNF